MDKCLADVPLEHQAILRVALEDQWAKGGVEEAAVGGMEIGRTTGSGGEHREKVKPVGVDVVKKAGNEYLDFQGKIRTFSSLNMYFNVAPVVFIDATILV